MPSVKITIPLHVIYIPPMGMHLIVKVKINNRVAKLVLDTGASQTVLDNNRIDRFMKETKFKKTNGLVSGVGTNKLKSHFVPVKKFQIGTFVLYDLELVMLDLFHVNNSYTTMNEKPVDGVLGGDLLDKLAAIINYKKKEMNLEYNF